MAVTHCLQILTCGPSAVGGPSEVLRSLSVSGNLNFIDSLYPDKMAIIMTFRLLFSYVQGGQLLEGEGGSVTNNGAFNNVFAYSC